MKTIILIGNLYSGKTTLAKLLEKEIRYLRLSIDDYRIKYGDGTVPAEDKAWDMLYKDALYAKNIILDSTGLSKQVKTRIWGATFYLGLRCNNIELIDRHNKEPHEVPFPYNFTDREESIMRMSQLIHNKHMDVKFTTNSQSPQEIVRLLKESKIFYNFINQ